MPGVRELVLDAFSWLGFKRTLGDGLSPVASAEWQPPQWTGRENHRRLTYYHLLDAYYRNSARRFRESMTSAGQGDIREYGDAALLVKTVMAAVLGSAQTLVVPGATPADGEADPTLAAAQDWYRAWWKAERGPTKLHQTERRAGRFGNGIYLLGWDPKVGRARLRAYDPASYFPVWSDLDEEFPSRVHLAWEVCDRATGLAESIRRITFDLRDSDDGVERTYPWRDESTRLVCYLTDATFELDQKSDGDIDTLDESNAAYREDDDGPVKDRDLGIDFIPIVSIMNTVDDGDGWGEATIAAVAQILDDLSQTDTNLEKAAGTSAQPVMIVSGASLPDGRLEYEPGLIIEAGDGSATLLDTSKALDALLKHDDSLLDRLSVNMRVPASLLGRVSPAEVPSGIALALSFGPLSSLVTEMRLARDDKYPMLLEFTRRLALANDDPAAPKTAIPCQLTFGGFLPQDKAAAVQMVRQLLGTAGEPAAISLETAAAMLVAAGFEIDDAKAEVALIRRTDYLAATHLRDATEDPVAVRELLAKGELPDLSGPPPEPPPKPAPPASNQPAPTGADQKAGAAA